MEDKKIRKFTKLSAAGFIIMAAIQFFGGISLILNVYAFAEVSSFSFSNFISGLILFAVYLAFAVLLLKSKNEAGFTAVAGVYLLYSIYCLIAYHSVSDVLSFLTAAAVLLLTLFDIVPALQDKTGQMKILWPLPPIFKLLSHLFTTVLMARNVLSSAQEQLAAASQQTIAVASILIPQIILLTIDVLTICFFSYRFYILSLQPQEEAESVTENYQYHPFG